MNSMDDASFKLYYKKYKLKVKLWESEFKKIKGRLPSKDDIKAASPETKEAYRKYWKLKTLNLQRTILDSASICGDESNSCFDDVSRESVCSDSLDSSSHECPTDRKILVDIQNESQILEGDNSICSNSIQLTENHDNSQDDLEDKSDKGCGVWGSHLNKVKPIAKDVVKLKARSSSFQLSKKLFEGSKFNLKRNPRKTHSFSERSKSETSISFEENSINSCDIPNDSIDLNDTKNDANSSVVLPCEETINFFPEFTSKHDKFKIVKSNVVESSPITVQRKSLLDPGSSLKPVRKIDIGWVERNTFEGVINGDSASIKKPDPDVESETPTSPEVFETKANFYQNNEKELSDPDEDLISDSDPESSQKASIFQSCKKRKIMSIDLTYKESSDLDNSISRPLKIQKCQTSASESINEKKEELPNVVVSLPKKCQTSASESVNEKKEELPNVVVSLPKITIDKLTEATEVSFSPLASKISANVKKGKQSKSSKLEALEKKMSSGKANENFVKINIKKKVYARGKKNTSFSKYKKMMYKKKAKDGDELCGRSIAKCFKCGDIGHYSRNCLKVEKLLPLDEAYVEESTFPSLEDAAEMAKKSNLRKHNRNETEGSNEDVNAVEEFSVAMEIFNNQNEVKPIYQLKEDQTVIDTPEEVFDVLKMFGHESFRAGQEQAIMRILSGQSTLLMLSTGAGKSLCYQLPAYLYSLKSQCITLVVSPLVSLMEDQVDGLPSFLKAACLHTNQTEKQREKVFELVKKGKVHFLLVSPEAVVGCSGGKGSKTSFSSLRSHLPPIAFACIDEVHCVSQWSHNFRPSYLMVSKTLRDVFKVKTVLGLTATATRTTTSSIASLLHIPDGEKGIIKGIPLPNNLILSVSQDSAKDEALITLLKSKRFKDCGSLIIYCTRRDECERVATLIRTHFQDPSRPESNARRSRISWNAEAYHAGLSAARRKKVQQSFMNGDIRFVVATVAFGMGINKHDIRGIIHYNMPRNFESYVQEVGRAGRDGLLAQCHVFLDSEGGDLNEHKRHIYGNSVDRHTIRKLLQKVFLPCSCGKQENGTTNRESLSENTLEPEKLSATSSVKTCPKHEVAIPVDDTVTSLDLPDENIATLLCYLELHPKQWIQVLNRVYTMCKIQCYNGPKQLRNAAHMCPPLAMAIASDLEQGVVYEKCSSIEFPVVKIASDIRWDSGVVKKHLKDLEWKKGAGDKWQRTGILVEFSVLGYHFTSPGNLSPSELDEALDSLHNRVLTQEETSLRQLESIFSSLTEVAHKTCLECSEEVDISRSDKLKGLINEYFQHEKMKDLPEPMPLKYEEQVRADIRNLVCSFREQTFTGRSVARILHGIPSPCFPALTWGRTRFWRLYLSSDFKILCKVATEEILRLR